MATKKPSSRKTTKKSNAAIKKTNKKNKNQAPTIIEATENKELQTEVLTASEKVEQTTTETIDTTQNMPTETTQTDITAPTEDTSDTSSLAPQASIVNTEQTTAQKQTYNNFVVPQQKDNTYAFIIGGIILVVTLTLFFL